MEFANGIYGMLEVARDFELDDEAPTTTPNVRGDVNYDGPADVFFDSDEAATIHYTTDGSEPTTASPTVQRRGARDGAAPIRDRPRRRPCGGSASTPPATRRSRRS